MVSQRLVLLMEEKQNVVVLACYSMGRNPGVLFCCCLMISAWSLVSLPSLGVTGNYDLGPVSSDAFL